MSIDDQQSASQSAALDDDELRAWKALLRANAALVSTIDHELEADHNLGLPDYEVLMQLSQADGNSLRMTELAREVLLSPSGLTRRLDGLVKAGYVERKPCPSDGRGLLAVMTEKGQSKLQEMIPTHVKSVRDHYASRISRDQLRDLVTALEPIANGDEATSSEPTTDGQTTDLTILERQNGSNAGTSSDIREPIGSGANFTNSSTSSQFTGSQYSQ